jgi:predicted kinase
MKYHINKDPIMYMLIGLPCTGKSTFANSLILSNPDRSFVIVSSDKYIEDEAAKVGANYNDVFEGMIGEASRRSNEDFKNAMMGRKNIIFDRTNLSSKKRKGILHQLPSMYYAVGVVFDVTDATHTEYMKKRTDKQISQGVIDNMRSNFTLPFRDEGFDEIEIIER